MFMADLITQAEERRITLSALWLEQQAQQLEMRPEAILEEMSARLAVMRRARDEGLSRLARSPSGLSGGDAAKITGGGLLGELETAALRFAIAIAEHNAVMGKIVACPTAGSCGIVPACLLAAEETLGLDDGALSLSLLAAAAVGQAAAENAMIAGAAGGCSAECGVAAAMAAAALTELRGGTPGQCGHAAAMALKAVLGMSCDPVAGLVEVPCIKRNGFGALNALAAAHMALCDVESTIPLDEVISALKQIGQILSPKLKETSQAGLAATPTGERVRERVKSL